MSDEVVLVQRPATADLTAGTLLRQAREATGLHIAALAVSMKVPVKKLEALEADRLEDLPDAVFVRALAASVCRALKIDAAPILSKLPHSVVPKLNKNDRGISMPSQGSGFLAGNSLMAFASRPAVLLVAGLLMAAMAVVLFPQARNTMGVAESAKPVAVPAAQDTVSSAAPVMADKVPAIAPGSESSVQNATVEPVQMPAPTPAPAAASTGLLVFKASGTSWVRVSDSKGELKFEKTLAAGETAVASGVPPLSVVVGNVAATEVLLRGQPFTMQDLNQNNVARFEVK